MTNKKIVYHPIQPEILELAAGHGTKVEQLTTGYWGALIPPNSGSHSNTVQRVLPGN